MDSPRLRYLLSKAYFSAAFLVATILAILDLTMAPAHGQVRTVTVTVYLTVVQTVPVYIPVTAYVTIAHVATSFITLTNTAVSLGTVTLWNTVSLWNTVTTAAAGILGPTPTNIFGRYSDIALAGIGALGGVAAGFASSIVAARRKYRRLRLDGSLVARLDESLVESARLAAELKSIAEKLKGSPLADLAGRRVDALISGFSTHFEDFDQKANELYELLSRLLREIKEAERGVVHGFP